MNIKVGDLVMVVRGHECQMKHFGGVVFKVDELLPFDLRDPFCKFCGGSISLGKRIVARNGDRGFPIDWLKKIDPPALPENTNNKEEIHA
jgi:hypothetical protein